MATPSDGQEREAQEAWEAEILAPHRWGQHGDRAQKELARVRRLWEAARPLDEACREVVGQICALEVCNWDLEDSLLALCSAIGARRPAARAIGHLASLSGERWRDVWAYYLALRDWLPRRGASGHGELLRVCDPEGMTRTHVQSLLGERTELKELYVERLCLCLEVWLGGIPAPESAQGKAHAAAVAAVEQEISRLDPEGEILNSMHLDGDGRLQPCHHKAFRRYDIILSSIRVGKWRGAMPMRGTDGLDRAATLERYLAPTEAWATGGEIGSASEGDELSAKIHALLGERDEVKVFLASLLVSLLRSDQLMARQLGESRRVEQ